MARFDVCHVWSLEDQSTDSIDREARETHWVASYRSTAEQRHRNLHESKRRGYCIGM